MASDVTAAALSAPPVLTPLQSGAGQWSQTFAVLLAAAFLGVLAVVIVINQYRRPDMDAENAAHILAQLRTFGGSQGSVVIREPDAATDSDVVANIRGLFHGETPDETTARSALAEIGREVQSELGERKPDAASVPVRALQEGVLTAVFGAIAVVPLAAWREAIESDAGGGLIPSLGAFLGALGDILGGFVGVLGSFPYLDVLFALGLTLGILTADTLWKLWVLPPLVLGALAAAYFALDYRVDTDLKPSGPSVYGWTKRVVTLWAVTWFSGIALATAGGVVPVGFVGIFALAVLAGVGYAYAVGGVAWDGRIPVPRNPNWKHSLYVAGLTLALAHAALAVLAAFTIASIVSVKWTRATVARWKYTADRHGSDALALDIVHSLTLAAAAVTLPLLTGYVLAAVLTGKLFAVAGLLLASGGGTAIAVAFFLLAVGLAAAIVFLDRFRDVRRGVRRAVSVRAVRSVLFARTLPFVLITVVAVLLLTLGLPVVLVAAVALTVGVMARTLYFALNYARYRVHMREGGDSTVGRVVVNGRKVTDSDGEPVFVADTNGHRTAHRELDALIRQIQRDTRSLFSDGEPESGSFARYFYKNGVLRGNVDIESVANELLGDIRSRFEVNVRDTDADAQDIMDKLHSEYPERAVNRVVQDLKDRGRVMRREDAFVWMGD